MTKQQQDEFETEFSTSVWRIIQKEGQFNFNPDGDPSRRMAIVLSDYTIVEVPVEERKWVHDNEKAMKAGTTVLVKFTRKRGA